MSLSEYSKLNKQLVENNKQLSVLEKEKIINIKNLKKNY